MWEPQPGYLAQLRSDGSDANALLVIVEALTSLSPGVPRPSLLRVLRETLYFTWEQPRLPRPLVQSKYPQAFPWSPRARTIIASQDSRPSGGYGLVFEHVIPKRVLSSALLDQPEPLKRVRLIQLLQQGTAVAIVSKDEDRQLPSGFDWTLDEYLADPWLRYRQAGFKLDEFAPLSDQKRRRFGDPQLSHSLGTVGLENKGD